MRTYELAPPFVVLSPPTAGRGRSHRMPGSTWTPPEQGASQAVASSTPAPAVRRCTDRQVHPRQPIRRARRGPRSRPAVVLRQREATAAEGARDDNRHGDPGWLNLALPAFPWVVSCPLW